jgi:hypothetical protein
MIVGRGARSRVYLVIAAALLATALLSGAASANFSVGVGTSAFFSSGSVVVFFGHEPGVAFGAVPGYGYYNNYYGNSYYGGFYNYPNRHFYDTPAYGFGCRYDCGYYRPYRHYNYPYRGYPRGYVGGYYGGY